MFIDLGNRYINLAHVTEIEFRNNEPSEPNAIVHLKDGTFRRAYLAESAIDALCGTVVAAPAGYFTHRPYDPEFEDSPEPFRWIPVVAFNLDRHGSQLPPITAEDGRLQQYAVQCPNGRVYTSSEEFFDSVEEYEKACRDNFKKQKNEAA